MGIALVVVAFAADNAKEDFCFSHAKGKCTEPGENWQTGACNSKHGGFEGDTDILHKMVLDDFTDSMTYLLMGSRFSTDVQNKMGFHNYFMEKSDSMWNRSTPTGNLPCLIPSSAMIQPPAMCWRNWPKTMPVKSGMWPKN